MPSFDIVSKVDIQKLDNAINTAKKELLNRYDFNNSKTTVELDKKTMILHVVTETDMRMKAIQDVILSRMLKQGIDPACMDIGEEEYASGNMLKKDIKIIEGIDKDVARQINKIIKESGIKVQASIMDDQVRVTGKKIDDLQKVMGLLRGQELDAPVQFINFR
jgi:uncharacterized protein YajQ (UPF0234 family)